MNRLKSASSLGERLSEAFVKASGWASSFLVVVIVVFLFSEGLSLFTRPQLDENLRLAVAASNPVQEMDVERLGLAVEGAAQTWKELGGTDDELLFLYPGNLEAYLKANHLVAKHAEERFGEDMAGLKPWLDSLSRRQPGLMVAFQPSFIPEGMRTLPMQNVNLAHFVGGGNWEPAESPGPLFGALPLLWGTLLVTLGALFFALLLGPPVAIYLAELATPRTRAILKPSVELLAGIPSVVFGFLGLVVLVPLIRSTFSLDSGSTALAGSFLLAVVALPTLISVAEDALHAVPRELKEASYGLGATHWQTIVRVSLPYARPGILASILLGVGRIVGETMVVLMVTGNNPQLVGFDFLASVRTMSAAIAAEMGEAPQGGLHYKALFAVGCLLFLLTFTVNLLGEVIKTRRRA